MRTAEADILILPGWSSSGPEHWQTRWERSLPTARRVAQDDWYNPSRTAWVANIHAAIATCQRPVILVGHSLGVMAAVHAVASAPTGHVSGVFLVAPADIENALLWPVTEGQRLDPADGGFAPIPTGPLACPGALVASVDDPYCGLERAREFATNWGCELILAGESGHINTASGHGPWPDGVLQFGRFLRSLPLAAQTPA
jgi:uncharacterized protein